MLRYKKYLGEISPFFLKGINREFYIFFLREKKEENIVFLYYEKRSVEYYAPSCFWWSKEGKPFFDKVLGKL